MKKATKQQRAAREKANPFRRGIPPSEEAMKLLLDELAKARAIYDGREKMLYGEGAAARRAGAFFAVNAVEMFLRDSRVRAHDLQPLIDISAAFTDHSRGKPNSLFASMKKGGGRHTLADRRVSSQGCRHSHATDKNRGQEKSGCGARRRRTDGSRYPRRHRKAGGLVAPRNKQ